MATLKAIQAEFEAFKRRQRWWQIGFAVAVVVLVLLLVTVFRSKGGPDESYLQQVQAMDSTIKYQQRTIETLRLFVLAQDTALSRLDRQYKANRPAETRIIRQYEKIPADINSLGREQLRREVSNF